MKTIGLLGGMSWESTQVYYRELNQQINQQLGGLHSAKIIMSSVDFAPIEQLMSQGDWLSISQILTKHCQTLEQAGSDFILIATNTMHKLAPEIQQGIAIPLLHIADTVGQKVQKQNIDKVGLLGTLFTMEQDFYRTKLEQTFSIKTLIPNSESRVTINQIIFDELCQGKFTDESKQHYLTVIDELSIQGAQAIILGCTEIGLLVQQQDTPIKLIDATYEHIKQAVRYSLSSS